MSVATVVRQRPWIVAVLLAGIIGVLVFRSGRSGEGEVAGTFCYTYADLDIDLARMERAILGQGERDDPDLSSHQGLAQLVWSDDVALGGPSTADADALIVATAVRSALEDESVEPLRSSDTLEARRRLAGTAAAACEGMPH